MWKKDPENITLKQNYKIYEKILGSVFKKDKYNYEQTNMYKCDRDNKKLWK